MNGIRDCNSVNLSDLDISDFKRSFKIIDLLGKKLNTHNNRIFFQMNKNGTVEKRIILD